MESGLGNLQFVNVHPLNDVIFITCVWRKKNDLSFLWKVDAIKIQ